MNPTLAITMGDPNGVGPEILAKTLNSGGLTRVCRPVIFGSLAVFEQAQKMVSGTVSCVAVGSIVEAAAAEPGVIPFLECGVAVPEYRPGTLDADAARCAMTWFERAVEVTMSGDAAGVVTCPINKEGIHRAGFTFQGHTDFIAEKTGTRDYRMCLYADQMGIVHLTGHLPLRQALEHVKKEGIVKSIELGDDFLSRLESPERRIAVAGLNPHAGEAGAFGEEEASEIAPAVAACRSNGIDCSGPLPPDTVFRRMREGEFDLAVAMYHDQGHIPLKLVAMRAGVNVTLGIPIVRTSVDHGTAYDIAGTGTAVEGSLRAAIELAARLAQSHGHPG